MRLRLNHPIRCTGWVIFFAILFPIKGFCQQSKEINNQLQTWFSVNSTLQFQDKWGMIGDFHVRRNNFIKDPSFYFLRFGANHWFKPNLSVAAGYAHLWLAPAPGLSTWSNEHRIWQQALVNTALGKTGLLLRLRNEQRWQEKINTAGVKEGWRFTNRVRLLTSLNFPLSKSGGRFSLVAADEVLLHFGKEVVYNTLDQNRLFLGYRQKLGSDLSYDFGYMMVYQQKYSGYQYDLNHTIRLFFYYSPDLRKDKKGPRPALDMRDE